MRLLHTAWMHNSAAFATLIYTEHGYAAATYHTFIAFSFHAKFDQHRVCHFTIVDLQCTSWIYDQSIISRCQFLRHHNNSQFFSYFMGRYLNRTWYITPMSIQQDNINGGCIDSERFIICFYEINIECRRCVNLDWQAQHRAEIMLHLDTPTITARKARLRIQVFAHILPLWVQVARCHITPHAIEGIV